MEVTGRTMKTIRAEVKGKLPGGAPDAVLFVPQSLAEGEQAQARENITAARKPLHIQAEFVEGNTAIKITGYTLEDLPGLCASGEVIVHADSEADGYVVLIGRLMGDMLEGALYTLTDDAEKPFVGRRVVVAGFAADPAALTLVGTLMYTDAPVDSTLSVAGAAADAAAVGEKIKNLPQPDWEQNDNSAPDYVKNRTHYYYQVIDTNRYPSEKINVEELGTGTHLIFKSANLTHFTTYYDFSYIKNAYPLTFSYDYEFTNVSTGKHINYSMPVEMLLDSDLYKIIDSKNYKFNAIVGTVYVILDISVLSDEYKSLFPEIGIYLQVPDNSNYTERTLTLKIYQFIKISVGYIPDTIARTAEVDTKISELSETTARKPVIIEASLSLDGAVAVKVTGYTAESLLALSRTASVTVVAASDADSAFLVCSVRDEIIRGTLYIPNDGDDLAPLAGYDCFVSDIHDSADAPETVYIYMMLTTPQYARAEDLENAKPLVINALLSQDDAGENPKKYLFFDGHTATALSELVRERAVTIIGDNAGLGWGFVGIWTVDGVGYGTLYIPAADDMMQSISCMVLPSREGGGDLLCELIETVPLSAAEKTAIAEEAAALVDAALLPLIGEVTE